jgi:hypothetical protein
LKFQALKNSIGINDAFYLVEKKKKEREGRRRSLHHGWIQHTRSTARWDPLSDAQII